MLIFLSVKHDHTNSLDVDLSALFLKVMLTETHTEQHILQCTNQHVSSVVDKHNTISNWPQTQFGYFCTDFLVPRPLNTDISDTSWCISLSFLLVELWSTGFHPTVNMCSIWTHRAECQCSSWFFLFSAWSECSYSFCHQGSHHVFARRSVSPAEEAQSVLRATADWPTSGNEPKSVSRFTCLQHQIILVPLCSVDPPELVCWTQEASLGFTFIG